MNMSSEDEIREMNNSTLHSENKYSLTSKVGSGYTSDVYGAWDDVWQRLIAIKVLRRHVPQNDAAELWSYIHHPHIVPLYEIVDVDGKTGMVMPLLSGTLEDEIMNDKHSMKPLSYTLAKRWIYESLCGLVEIHSMGLCHMNIKPENILLTLGNTAKIGGFSMLRRNNIGFNKLFHTSPLYSPPELWNKNHSTVGILDYQMIDVWMFGISVLAILLGKEFRAGLCDSKIIGYTNNGFAIWSNFVKPFLHKLTSIYDFKKLMERAHPIASLDNNEIKNASTFIRGFLSENPTERVSSIHALEDPFLFPFNEIHFFGRNYK